jgi:FK506-binding nuclear protein
MAAIDPTADPEFDDADDKRPPRSTLKVVRVPDSMFDDSDDDSEDDEDFLAGLVGGDEDDESSEDDEEVNGGPSDRKLNKQALLEALAADEDDDEEMGDDEENEDDDDEADEKAIALLKKLMKDAKGKGKALEGQDDDESDEDEEDSDDEAVEMDEVVICTLDPEKNYQQTLDFVVAEGEKVFFKVSGTHTVHLTGNYVIPQDDGQASLYDEDDEDSDDYDLSPDEDELDALEDLDEESDELDDLENPRITQLDSEDEEVSKPTKDSGKGKNKRPAQDSEDDEDGEANLDDIMAKTLKKEDAVNGETKKLSKAEKKKLKKLKKNDGEAVTTEVSAPTVEVKKDAAQTNGTSSEKKVQFAKNLEQGPTPSGTSPAVSSKTEKASTSTASVGVKDIQGVTIDDRKIGTGPAAKKGSRLEMRYIGKLDNGKVFDSNKSGKPFGFKLGAGEVIKGWDIGLAGIQVGGERRLVIPAHLAYGSKALPGIPKNSKLTFDIKCLSIK